MYSFFLPVSSFLIDKETYCNQSALLQEERLLALSLPNQALLLLIFLMLHLLLKPQFVFPCHQEASFHGQIFGGLFYKKRVLFVYNFFSISSSSLFKKESRAICPRSSPERVLTDTMGFPTDLLSDSSLLPIITR